MKFDDQTGNGWLSCSFWGRRFFPTCLSSMFCEDVVLPQQLVFENNAFMKMCVSFTLQRESRCADMRPGMSGNAFKV